MFKTKKIGEFDNALTENHRVHYSRYVVSWLKAVLEHKDILTACNSVEIIFGNDFIDWLTSVGLTEDEIRFIRIIAMDGKLELEESASAWIQNL